MKTNSEKTELALCSISISWIVESLFKKYAPKFSDGLDWKAFAKLGREARKNMSVVIKNKLKDEDAVFHNELCGALNLISIASHARKIRQHMARVATKTKEVRRKISHEALRNKNGDGQINEPVNMAAWFCIHETDMPSEWDKIKQFAIAEEQTYYNWSWYPITDPTKDSSDDDIKDFEKALKEIFQREKDDRNFAAKAYRLAESKLFIRYCVSTAKDPIETFLAQNGGIERGNDPTANTFLIDHYFNSNYIRVAFPDVIEQDRVAVLFAEHVLGASVTAEEPRIYLRSMRKYASREDSEELFLSIRGQCKNLKDIRLKSIRFTVAENIKLAEIRRRESENKRRTKDGLPALPRLKCEVFDEGNVFDEMQRCFTHNARRKELMDVYELVFRIDLFDESKGACLSDELRDSVLPTTGYSMRVTSKSVRFVPRIQEVSNNAHRQTLVKIQKLLSFANEPAKDILRR